MRRPEEALHRAIVQWLSIRIRPPAMFWHTPNGMGRSKAEAGILKAYGTKAGMPDLFVLEPPGPRLIAIEIKAPPKRLKSGKPSRAKPRTSEAQEAVLADLAACGVEVVIARSIDDVAQALRPPSSDERRRAIDAAVLAKMNLGARR